MPSAPAAAGRRIRAACACSSGEPLLEPERRMDPRQLAVEAVRRRRDSATGRIGRRRAPSRAVPPSSAIDVAVGDERLDFEVVAPLVVNAARPAEVRGDAPERAMDQHADRALGPAEHARDLGGRHLVDEPQDERPPAIGREAARPRPGALGLGRAGSWLASTSVARRVPRPPRGAPAGAPQLRRRFATSLRAIWNSQTRKVEAPSPSAGRARSSNRGRRRAPGGRPARSRPRRRGGCRARRRRSCTPARDTCDTGRRMPGRVALRGLDQRTIAIEMRDLRSARRARAACCSVHLPQHPRGHFVTPGLRSVSGEPDVDDLADGRHGSRTVVGPETERATRPGRRRRRSPR